jgi:uncharacterized protein
MCSKEKLNSILEALQKSAEEIFKNKLEAVILYGSYARGDFDDESDIDVMIIVDIDKENLLKYRKLIYKIAHDIGFENDILISPHLQDRETFENWSDVVPFYQNVKREGLYINVTQ